MDRASPGVTTEPRRLGVIIPGLGPGGAERVAVNVADLLRGQVETEFLCFTRNVAYEIHSPVRVVGTDFLSADSLPRRGVDALRTMLAVQRAKAAGGYHTTLSFMTFANVFNVRESGGARAVLSVHNRESVNHPGRSGAAIRAMIRLAYPRARRIVAVSEGVADDLHSNFGVRAERIVVIPNGVDLPRIEELSAQLPPTELRRFLDGGPFLLAVGRLVPQKGVWHLLRVFGELRKKQADARLLIVGDGPLRSRLRQLADELGLLWWDDKCPTSSELITANLAFVSHVHNPFALMRRSAAFVFPSLWEGFGNVVVEALASHATVIAADCQAGPREILAGASRTTPLTGVEDTGIGCLLPVLDGMSAFSTAPLTPTEHVWLDALAERLASEPREIARTSTAVSQRLQSFDLATQRPLWESVLFGD